MEDRIIASIIGKSGSSEILCVDKFIGDESMRSIVARLKSDGEANRKRLVLRGNCIGHGGATALADLIETNSSFQFISIEWNQIASVGAIEISKALAFNKALKHLDLRNNGISDDGAIALANVLTAVNTSLQILDLRWNQITDSGATAFRYVFTLLKR